MELIKNNYLYGTGHGKDWKVNIDPPKRKVKTYFEETIIALEDIYANKSGKFQVLYSGGVDSQYVCEVLLHLGMEFEPIIVELKNNEGQVMNMHDIKYAYDFCSIKNISPIKFDLNFQKFVESGKNIEIAKSATCCGVGLPTMMYVASQLDGFSLMGNGDPYLRLEPNNFWYLEERENTHSLLRFYKKYRLNGCPFLLSYTAEMMLAFLLDPNIVKVGMGFSHGKKGTNSSKSLVYNNKSKFNLPVYDYVSKYRIKQHGYENLNEFPIIAQHPNIKIFDDYQKMWGGEYLETYLSVITRLSIHQ